MSALRPAELHLEQLRRRFQHARLDSPMRKIRPHRLRVEIELRAPELLVPVAAADDVNLAQPQLTPQRKLEHQRVLVLRPIAAPTNFGFSTTGGREGRSDAFTLL